MAVHYKYGKILTLRKNYNDWIAIMRLLLIKYILGRQKQPRYFLVLIVSLQEKWRHQYVFTVIKDACIESDLFIHG